MSTDKYEVLEHAGMENETSIDTFNTLLSAQQYIANNYTLEEIEQLCVDITLNGTAEHYFPKLPQ